MRLLVNGFLFSVATIIISISLFRILRHQDITIFDFKPTFYPSILVAMFIIVFFLVIMANHSDNRISSYGILVLCGFFFYGLSDVRYMLVEATGGDASGPFADSLFLLSIVLLGMAYTTPSVINLMDENERARSKRSGTPGIILATLVLSLGLIFMILGAMDFTVFAILLIACMAYFLLSKILQVNELNEQ